MEQPGELESWPAWKESVNCFNPVLTVSSQVISAVPEPERVLAPGLAWPRTTQKDIWEI